MTTVKQQIKCRKICNEIAPKLGVHTGSVIEIAQLDAGFPEKIGMKMTAGCSRSQIRRGVEKTTYFNKQTLTPGPEIQLGKPSDFRVDAKIQHKMADDRHVEINEPVISA